MPKIGSNRWEILGTAPPGWGFGANPGNFGNCLTHVGVFERSHVVGAVPAHEGGVAQALQGCDHEFLPGKTPGKAPKIPGIPNPQSPKSREFPVLNPKSQEFPSQRHQIPGIQGWNGPRILHSQVPKALKFWEFRAGISSRSLWDKIRASLPFPKIPNPANSHPQDPKSWEFPPQTLQNLGIPTPKAS